MGYGITIGERGADGVASATASPPVWPGGEDCPGRGNLLAPSYVGWFLFLDAVGLRAWWDDPRTGVNRNERRFTRLYPKHARAMADALTRYTTKHPDAQPGWCDCYDRRVVPHDHPPRDPHLARLHWLDYWIRWALATCDRPTIDVT